MIFLHFFQIIGVNSSSHLRYIFTSFDQNRKQDYSSHSFAPKKNEVLTILKKTLPFVFFVPKGRTAFVRNFSSALNWIFS